jgi:hypothetical protein
MHLVFEEITWYSIQIRKLSQDKRYNQDKIRSSIWVFEITYKNKLPTIRPILPRLR